MYWKRNNGIGYYTYELCAWIEEARPNAPKNQKREQGLLVE